ncbi:Mn(2+) uptake NRAMP transporter MntH [Nakamurella flava]|uniref:Mn(2+) uptake NRAMP transporter MntH n=1 Tax=Nakamurella flava TaxID=2576308 RepID=A0A4U6QJL8_9ACTN|nr:Nramp family divalent metal transporter [Nakamurella flava]TKV60399.1 Mn(2+) uptake NRAMP transporter MntH [Nakamurella flava]
MALISTAAGGGRRAVRPVAPASPAPDPVSPVDGGPSPVGASSRWRRLVLRLGCLGPAFVAAVAYVDPGNVAANLQAGAQYGYLLVWVLVLAVAAAGVVQFLSAKVGLVTGLSLPELLGRRLARRSRLAFWVQAEGVAMATDLAEVVGGAIALWILFDLPLVVGGAISGVVAMGLLTIQSARGQRSFERVVTGFLAIIAIGFVAGLFVAPPSPGGVAAGLVPRFDGTDSVLLAAAMMGATVMPHAVYLHSALSRDRFGRVGPGPRRRRLLSATRLDVTVAMVLAGGVNIAMLLVAASGLHGLGGSAHDPATIEGAHAAISDTLGPSIGVMFAIGLLASGLASTSVGSYAGGVIMEGLLQRRMPAVLRRVVTLIPALLILALGADPTSVLIVSQVVLSFGLPFVLVPLMRMTSNAELMGPDVNGRGTRLVGWSIVIAIVVLNIFLIAGVFLGF